MLTSCSSTAEPSSATRLHPFCINLQANCCHSMVKLIFRGERGRAPVCITMCLSCLLFACCAMIELLGGVLLATKGLSDVILLSNACTAQRVLSDCSTVSGSARFQLQCSRICSGISLHCTVCV